MTDCASLRDRAAWPFDDDRIQRLGVAVSGGGDSLALLDLMARRGLDVRAVTVDHGLRPEAADEVRLVADRCAEIGIPHDALTWVWDGAGNLQAAARAARYQLIGGWARRHGLDAVALGHTADDVAETLLMRLGRAAGLDGLAAMARDFERHGMRWLRPVLDVRRADLRGHLRALGWTWAEDASNDDPRFDRVRARAALEALAPLGVGAGEVAQSAAYLAQDAEIVRYFLEEAAARAVRVDRGDVVIADPAALHPGIARRLFMAALRWVSGAEFTARRGAVAEAFAALADGRSATLGGCLASVNQSGSRVEWRITREFNAVKNISSRTDEVWDTRWQVFGPTRGALTIRALGDAVSACPDWRTTGLPRQSLIASPAVWDGADLVAAPLAGFGDGWTAHLSPGRDDFAAALIRR